MILFELRKIQGVTHGDQAKASSMSAQGREVVGRTVGGGDPDTIYKTRQVFGGADYFIPDIHGFLFDTAKVRVEAIWKIEQKRQSEKFEKFDGAKIKGLWD